MALEGVELPLPLPRKEPDQVMFMRTARGEANLNVGMAVVRAVAKFKMLRERSLEAAQQVLER